MQRTISDQSQSIGWFLFVILVTVKFTESKTVKQQPQSPQTTLSLHEHPALHQYQRTMETRYASVVCPNNDCYQSINLSTSSIVTILDTLSANLFNSLTLEFHYQPIHPYDALLIKEGVQYKCVSLMTNNPIPDRIYMRIGNVMV